MPPDLLLECTACGSQAVWDTGAVPPVGLPEVGHPVRWFCQTCGREVRHTIVDLSVLIDKLHREICVATEIDRGTAERVMSQVYRHRRVARREILTLRLHAAQQVKDVAQAAGVSLEVVEQISVAEAAWMPRRGYIVEECPGDVRGWREESSAPDGWLVGKNARGEGKTPHPAMLPGPGRGRPGVTSCCASRWARSRGWPRRCTAVAAARSSAPSR